MSDYLRVGNVLGAAWHAALGPVRGRHGFGHHAKGTEMHAVRRLFVVTQIIRFQSQVRVVHDAMAAGRAACPAHSEFSRGYGHKHGWGRGRSWRHRGSWRHRAAASRHRRQTSADDMVVGIARESDTGDCKTCIVVLDGACKFQCCGRWKILMKKGVHINAVNANKQRTMMRVLIPGKNCMVCLQSLGSTRLAIFCGCLLGWDNIYIAL